MLKVIYLYSVKLLLSTSTSNGKLVNFFMLVSITAVIAHAKTENLLKTVCLKHDKRNGGSAVENETS